MVPEPELHCSECGVRVRLDEAGVAISDAPTPSYLCPECARDVPFVADSKDTGEKPTTYTFPVCLICEMEIDESNEHRHQGPLHDVQRVEVLPLQVIRERLTSDEAVIAAAKLRHPLLAQYEAKHMEMVLVNAKSMLEAALDAAFSKEEAG